ncbi:FtsX-like permease family protein [Bdellovibrio sp. HCB337]|uniref:FtsX-like permease family protein n=1 Tax=Bdellovibrio sp. HCB337 TaxID=3394358 RepID=UPI0039A52303
MLVRDFFSHFIFSKRAGALVKRLAWLSVGAIALSVTAFLVVLFVMNGMNASIHKRILSLEPHLYVTVNGVSRGNLLEIHPVFQRLKETPENKAYVYETQDVILRTMDGQFHGAIARGVSQESLKFMVEQLHKMEDSKKKQHENVQFWSPEELPGKGEVVLGVDLARSLGVFEGDYLTIVPPEGLLLPPGESPKFEKVRISKIISTNLADLDSQFVFYQRNATLNTLASAASRKVGIEVWTPDGKNLEDLKTEVEKFSDVMAETWMDRNSVLFFALKLEKLMIGVFLGLAGLIAASSILSVLALLMSQKKRDIAILKTLGLSSQRTVKIFTQMGMMLSAIGIIPGVVLGTALSLYIEKNPINVLPDIYYDSQVPALVDVNLIWGVLIVGLLVCLGGAWYPARTSTEIEPARALRVKN